VYKRISKLAVGAWLLSMSASVAFGNSTEFGYWTTYSKDQRIYATTSNNNSNGTEEITISCINDKLQATIKYLGGDKNIQQGAIKVIGFGGDREGKEPAELDGHLRGDYITITDITQDFIALFPSARYPYIPDHNLNCGTNEDCLAAVKEAEAKKRDSARFEHISISITDKIRPVFKIYGASAAIAQVTKTCPNGLSASYREMHNYTHYIGNSLYFDGSGWRVVEEVDKFTGERKISAQHGSHYGDSTRSSPYIEVNCVNGKKLNILFYIYNRQWYGNVYNKEAKSKVEIIAVSEGHKPVKTTKWKANGDDMANEYVTKEFLDILQNDKYKYTDYIEKIPTVGMNRGYIDVKFKNTKESYAYFKITDNLHTFEPHVSMFRAHEALALVLKACPNGFAKSM
jgi:hypothetical protein